MNSLSDDFSPAVPRTPKGKAQKLDSNMEMNPSTPTAC